MPRDEIVSRLTSIFREVLRSKDLNLQETMVQGDLRGWDSMNHTQIVLTIEEKFEIELSTNEILALKTVGDMIRTIEKKLSS